MLNRHKLGYNNSPTMTLEEWYRDLRFATTMLALVYGGMLLCVIILILRMMYVAIRRRLKQPRNTVTTTTTTATANEQVSILFLITNSSQEYICLSSLNRCIGTETFID